MHKVYEVPEHTSIQCSLQHIAIYPPILFRAQRLYELLFTILNSNPVLVLIRTLRVAPLVSCFRQQFPARCHC